MEAHNKCPSNFRQLHGEQYNHEQYDYVRITYDSKYVRLKFKDAQYPTLVAFWGSVK